MKNILLLIALLITCSLIAQEEKIVVGCDFNYPPFSYINEEGQAVGYDIDVMTTIAELTGLDIEFKLASWDSVLLYLENGEVDIVTSIVYSAEREENFDFSFPLHTEYYGIFAKKGIEINDVNDLGLKVPAILTGDVSNELFIKPMGFYDKAITAQSFPEAFNYVNNGECDYVVAPYALGMDVIKEKGLKDIEVKGPPVIPSVFCFAVKDGRYELLAYVNQGIELLGRNGKLDKIYKKWVKHRRDDDKYKTFFYYTLIGIALLIAIVIIALLFVYMLKKQVEKKAFEIKKNEAIYQKVFNEVDEGLIILNEYNQIIEANKKAYDLFPLNKGSLVGETVDCLTKGSDESKVGPILEKIKQRVPFFEENMVRTRSDKTDYAVIKGLTIDIDKEERYMIVVHNVTKERVGLLKLKEAKQDVEMANSAKSKFLSTISHEIRTPLFAINGYTSLISETKLDKEQKNFANKIGVAGNLLLNLVNNILDFTKLEAGKTKINSLPFSLCDLVTELYEMESIKAEEKKLKLDFIIGDEVPGLVLSDKLVVSRILLNLINNAIKFTTKGSVKLSINVRSFQCSDKGEVANIIFSVKDTGIGMLEKDLRRLFMPFEQMANYDGRKFGGTGLGLAITKQLVGLLNGKIFVESELGKGSVFVVSLPLQVYEEKVKPVEGENIEKSNNKSFNVLLVEDNEFNAEIIIRQLSSSGFLVEHVGSGLKAIDKLKDKHFDIVLLDIEMPDMDGFETMCKIKNEGLDNIPVLALSAHDLATEKEKALKSGMVDYLNKPITSIELCSAINKYIKVTNVQTEITDEVIDEVAGLNIFENDEQAYQNSLLRFKKHFSGFPEKLREAFENDKAKLKDYMHNLKSAGRTIGALCLAELASKYEADLKELPENFSLEELEGIINSLNNVLAEIDKVNF